MKPRDADRRRLRALTFGLRRLGAEVHVGGGRENLTRLIAPRSASAWPLRPRTGPPVVEIHAEGLPNLLHEAVHLLLGERLDHDHGFDYHAIPLPLHQAAGRQALFEELACCVVSCAYVGQPDAWFAEQVEILPVFFGMDCDPEGFRRQVDGIARDRAAHFQRTLGRAYARLYALMRFGGAMPRDAAPAQRFRYEAA